MAHIPTAKQVYYKVTGCILEDHHFSNIEQAMIEFAKIQVTAALKEACKQVEVVMFGNSPLTDDASILRSYPLTNIK
jgi:hypothetical protein